MNKTGKVSWNEKTGSNKETKEYARLSDGPNLFRIITEPFQYHQHKMMFDGGAKWGHRVNCAKTQENDHCPACELTDVDGHQPITKWLVGVIDRETNQWKVLDLTKSMYDGIGVYANDPDWGHQEGKPYEYDVNIIKNSKAKSFRDFYKVSCKPKSPLTSSDILMMEENGEEYLVQKTTPPTPEQVQIRIDKILADIEAGGGTFNQSKENKSSDINDNDFFKEYKAKSA